MLSRVNLLRGTSSPVCKLTRTVFTQARILQDGKIPAAAAAPEGVQEQAASSIDNGAFSNSSSKITRPRNNFRNSKEASPTRDQLKSKTSWGKGSNGSLPQKSAQATISEQLSEITEMQSEEPIYVAQSLERKFMDGDAYNPFDFSLNRIRMERKQRQKRFQSPEDPFEKSGINPETLYLMPEILSNFLTSTGQIMPRSQTGCSATNQRRLTAAIRTARNLGLLASVHRHYRYMPQRNI
ncbi:mitochondrial 37S ribosomal protein bS18m [Lodderomyces beijingensis]|uniref:Small ribosomal subunit protein bS18m n=1 Tax=Lodderomyces beijingensis TaxID=1775926 RepID=A0ABP0ZKF6_9ASCO